MGLNSAKCPYICSQPWFSYLCLGGGLCLLLVANGMQKLGLVLSTVLSTQCLGEQEDPRATKQPTRRRRARAELCPLRSLSVTKVTPCHCLGDIILCCSPPEQPEGLSTKQG